MNLSKTIKRQIKLHALAELPNECCGLIAIHKGRRRYIPCRNVSVMPGDFFQIHPDDWAEAEEKFAIAAVVHSHPTSSPDPTEQDRAGCNASKLPWVIYSPMADSYGFLDPENTIAPLVGRSYAWGASDCFTVVRDWYATQGVTVPDFPRSSGQDWDADPYFDKHFEAVGFKPHDGVPQRGDGILMSLGRNDGRSNHCAVYLGDGKFLHHLQHRLSSIDVYGGPWRDYSVRWLRHKDARPEWEGQL